MRPDVLLDGCDFGRARILDVLDAFHRTGF